jgi:hypothetical protein
MNKWEPQQQISTEIYFEYSLEALAMKLDIDRKHAIKVHFSLRKNWLCNSINE